VFVFAAIRVILTPTAAVDSVALLLHNQQFPSFSPDVGAGYAIGELGQCRIACAVIII
jgi:hypothetical protein